MGNIRFLGVSPLPDITPRLKVGESNGLQVVSPAAVQHVIPLDLGVEHGVYDVVDQADDESDGHDDDHYGESDHDD